jgi:GNAT superfamily N-acetyltransferase
MIHIADKADIPALNALIARLGHNKKADYFEPFFDKNGHIFVFQKDSKIVGYGFYNRAPKYQLYKRLNIPEIQDLNIDAHYRQQGLATALIQKIEACAKKENYENIGISVGLTKEYGPAQRLYFKLGYQPDGFGLTYDRLPVTHGQPVLANNDLCLMMIKNFQEQ